MPRNTSIIRKQLNCDLQTSDRLTLDLYFLFYRLTFSSCPERIQSEGFAHGFETQIVAQLS